MLKPQKDTIYPAIQIAKKQYEIKKSLAASLYFYLSVHGSSIKDTETQIESFQQYQDVKNELMDLKIHIEVLEELAKDAE